MRLIFWTSALVILYTYFGYALLLLLITKVYTRQVRKSRAEQQGTVTVVIAAKNEAKNISKRIDNLLEQDFSAPFEIIVVSDGSSDGTADTVKNYIRNQDISRQPEGGRGKLKLIELPYPRGKAEAVNIAVEQAAGEIIVFTDARQEFRRTALRELVGNFNDPGVGCVSGELIFKKDKESAIQEEMEAYWDYEKLVRRSESRVHSVCGATGCIYAIRRSLFKKMPEGLLLDDVYVSMQVVLQGFRTVFDAGAVAYDWVAKDFDAEKRRKIRTLVGNWQLIKIMPALLLPGKNPIFVQYLSHKVFRLIMPFCFLACMLSSLLILEWFYQAAFCCMAGLLMLPALEDRIRKPAFLIKAARLSRAVINLNYWAMLSCLYFVRKKENVWIK